MDITKCNNEECQLKGKCLRYLCEANEFWQSYATFECNKENNWQYLMRCNILERE